VEVLTSPKAFYEALMECAGRAAGRVVLSSLYVGGGPRERALLETLQARLGRMREMQMRVLVDANRAERRLGEGDATSVSLLQPLVNAFPHRVILELFQAPLAGGAAKPPFYVRGRLRELPGVMHAKAYLFDDTLILSGANLSESYFTTRQDRAVLIRGNSALADFYDRLLGVFGYFAQRRFEAREAVSPDGALGLPSLPLRDADGRHEWTRESREEFRRQLHALLSSGGRRVSPEFLSNPAATLLFPTVQAGAVGLAQDNEVFEELLLSHTAPQFAVDVATGYASFSPRARRLLGNLEGALRVLVAAPGAHGWHGARGAYGLVPRVYDALLSEHVQAMARGAQPASTLEYARADHSFHAKGVWIDARGGGGGDGGREASPGPFLSLVGSSNYGRRSLDKDVEVQALLATNDSDLRRALRAEREALFAHGTPVGPDSFFGPRAPPRWARALVQRYAQFM
jgi:CDP-diacylglycerol--glycerol-3-phosphate 3-phosphatidyltransferase